jgi:hypothetical protein
MSTIWRSVAIIGRLCRIALAYLVAVSVAALALFFGVIAMEGVKSGTWLQIGVGSTPGTEASRDGSGLVLLAWLVVVLATIGPALVAVACSESFAVRRYLFHASCGVLAAAVPFLFLQSGVSHPPPLLEIMPIFGVVLAAGCIGGSVSWVIAGRSSDNWPPCQAKDAA